METARQGGGGRQLIVRIGCSNKSQAVAPTPASDARERVAAVVNATVPAGSTGEVHVPLAATIRESGQLVWRRDGGAVHPGVAGVSVLGSDGRFVIFATGSGTYSFASA
jgi:hypothetical protein